MGAPKGRPAPRSRPHALALRSGGRLVVEADGPGETVTLLSADGAPRLAIRLDAGGVVLVLPGERVAIEAAGELALRCGSLEIDAGEIALRSRGSLRLDAGRGLDVRAGEDASLSAQAVQVEGRTGEVSLRANDDVALNGERVLLNCPTEEDAARREAAATTLEERLRLPFRPPDAPRRLPRSGPVPEDEP